jgi:CBS domain containing-hemolysin-like protein
VEALTDLRDMDVREVMTPRLDVVALTIPVSADDVAQAVRESGHSAFPVVNGVLDDVVGVLYINDLFRSRRSGRGALFTGMPTGSAGSSEGSAGTRGVGDADAPPDGDIEGRGAPAASGPAIRSGQGVARAAAAADAGGLSPLEVSRRIRQPYVIPESRPILAALVEMRRHRRGFAIVVDEYGGLAGVLTVKDLLEPIVGDLQDELDADEGPSIVRVDGSRWLVDGRTNVDEVRERLGIDVPEGDYVTIGGYLLDGLGHIPAVGEALRMDGWELTVQEMDKRRIASVVARRLDADTETGARAELPVRTMAVATPRATQGPPDEQRPDARGAGRPAGAVGAGREPATREGPNAPA